MCVMNYLGIICRLILCLKHGPDFPPNLIDLFKGCRKIIEKCVITFSFANFPRGIYFDFLLFSQK